MIDWPKPVPSAPRHHGVSRRVVVADNDPDALDLVVTDLSLEGHQIVGTALDGDGAIDLCRRLRPDVLVVDYRMPPGPNGVEVGAVLHRELPDVGMILHTNYESHEIARGAARNGMTLVLKGNLRRLRDAVRKAAPT